MGIPEFQALTTLMAVFSFIFGTVFGSFANVCIYRWPAGLSVVKPRSRCPKCEKPISGFDNIPLLSWVILRAKCRHCALPIPIRYPLVELLTGILFMLVYLRFGNVWATPIYMALCFAMVVVTFVDLDHWIIPDQITLPGIPIGIGVALLALLMPEEGLRIAHPLAAMDGVVLGAFVIAIMDRAAIVALKKPGMGGGDLKLLALLGAFLGWRGVLGTLMMASIVGSVIGIAVMAYFKLRGGEEEEQEPTEEEIAEDEAMIAAWSVDLLNNIILCGGYLYLSLRASFYLFATENPIPEEFRSVMLLAGLFVGLMVAICVALPLMQQKKKKAIKKKKGKKSEKPKKKVEEEEDMEVSLAGHYLPFGPYLAIAGLLFMFFGPELIQLYMNFIGAGNTGGGGLFP